MLSMLLPSATAGTKRDDEKSREREKKIKNERTKSNGEGKTTSIVKTIHDGEVGNGKKAAALFRYIFICQEKVLFGWG